MLIKKQTQQKRLQLLAKQEQLSTECETCKLKEAYHLSPESGGKYNWNTSNCRESGCEVYKALLGIGADLEKLSQQKKEARMKVSLNDVFANKGKTSSKNDQRSLKVNESLANSQKSLPDEDILTKAELKRLFDALHELTQDKEKLIEARTSLQAVIAQHEQTILELEQAADHMRDQFTGAQSAIDDLQHEYDVLRNELANLHQQPNDPAHNRIKQLNTLLMQEVLVQRGVLSNA